jgi:hypothetical protein
MFQDYLRILKRKISKKNLVSLAVFLTCLSSTKTTFLLHLFSTMTTVKPKMLSVTSQGLEFKEKPLSAKLPNQEPLRVKMDEVGKVEEMVAIVEVNVAMVEIAEEGVSSAEGKVTSPENVLLQDKTIIAMIIVLENSTKSETESQKIKRQTHRKEDL